MAHAGVVLQNTYVLVEKLGAGGMGEVYAAEHTRLRKRFAVKVLVPRHGDNREAFARFQREAEITSRLGHPNIVQVVDFNETAEGQPYLVMELLEGEDLADRIARGPLAADRALHIADQIASALQAAHGHDVVHRDLKPNNVFLARRGDDDAWVKLLDFGISKIRGEASVTQSQVVIGTPGYMAPEQAEGHARSVDARSDQFAVAVIVYEMLTGVSPFAAESIPSTLYRVVHHHPPSLGELVPEVPEHVVAAVGRAMSKAADDRFPDIATFAAALRGQLAAEAIVPARPRVVVRAGSSAGAADTLMSANTEISTAERGLPAPSSRSRWPLAGAAALALAVVAVLAVSRRGGGEAPRDEPAPVAAPAPPADAGPAAVVTPDATPVVAAPPDAGPEATPPTDTRRGRRGDRRRAAEPAKPEPAKPEPAKPEPAKPEPAKPERTESDFIVDF